jgi:hypothetical protein
VVLALKTFEALLLQTRTSCAQAVIVASSSFDILEILVMTGLFELRERRHELWNPRARLLLFQPFDKVRIVNEPETVVDGEKSHVIVGTLTVLVEKVVPKGVAFVTLLAFVRLAQVAVSHNRRPVLQHDTHLLHLVLTCAVCLGPENRTRCLPIDKVLDGPSVARLTDFLVVRAK